MGLSISVIAKPKKEYEPTFEWEFDGRSTFNYFRDFMVSQFNYKYGEDMPLDKNKIKLMVKKIIDHSPNFGDDDIAINRNCEMLGALLTCRNIIDNGGEAT